MSSDSRLTNEDALLAPREVDARRMTVRLAITAPNEALAQLTLARLLALWQVNSEHMVVEWPFSTTPNDDRRPNATASADLAIIKGRLRDLGADPTSETAPVWQTTPCGAAVRPNAGGESVPTKEPGSASAGASDDCPATTVADAEDAEIRMFAASTASWDAATIRNAYERTLSWGAAALVAGTCGVTRIGRIVCADLLRLGHNGSVSDAVPARNGILAGCAGLLEKAGRLQITRSPAGPMPRSAHMGSTAITPPVPFARRDLGWSPMTSKAGLVLLAIVVVGWWLVLRSDGPRRVVSPQAVSGPGASSSWETPRTSMAVAMRSYADMVSGATRVAPPSNAVSLGASADGRPAVLAPLRPVPAQRTRHERPAEGATVRNGTGAVGSVFTGSLEVVSAPKGAVVIMNGQPVGITPFELRRVRAGSHALTVDLDGYLRWSTAVTVVSGSKNRVTARLLRLRDQPVNEAGRASNN